MKLVLNCLSLSFFILFFSNLIENSFAAGLYGGKTVAYTTTQVNFRDQQRATGFVRMTNGFTLATPASGVGSTHGASRYTDTCLSVSGAIDLRNTNTIILLSDLILDNGVTLSSGGRIYGYDRALILDGDLTIPAGNVIHIGGRIVIDGRGNKLILGRSSQLFVDAGATLTLRNLVLQNTQNNLGNPPIQCSTSGSAAYCSKLCLDNVELALANDFCFSRGQMFINNDVAVTGTSALQYRSQQPLIINSESKLYFDVNSTFSIAPLSFTNCPYSTIPTTTTNNFIKMADQTSQLYLNGCNLCATITGCRLTAGSVFFDNRVSIKSNAANDISSTPVTSITSAAASGTNVGWVEWSPDDRYLLATSYAGNKFQIFYFNGSSLTDLTSGGISITEPLFSSWSPDGKFVAIGSQTTNSINIYSVINGVPTLLSTVPATSGHTELSAVKWSPDGRYIAASYASTTVGGGIQVFAFNGRTAIPVSSISPGVGQYLYSLSWSPDGKFLASGSINISTTTALQIFSFAPPSTLTLVGTIIFSDNSGVTSSEWSPDGRFIGILRSSPDFFLQVYSLQGTSHIQLAGSVYAGQITPSIMAWFPFGKYIAVCGYSISNIQIYNFSGFGAPTLVGQAVLPGGATASSLGISHNGHLIAVGGNTPGTVYIYSINYIRTQASQALSQSIVFGNSALGSSYDTTVRGLSGAQMVLDGLINYDCVS